MCALFLDDRVRCCPPLMSLSAHSIYLVLSSLMHSPIFIAYSSNIFVTFFSSLFLVNTTTSSANARHRRLLRYSRSVLLIFASLIAISKSCKILKITLIIKQSTTYSETSAWFPTLSSPKNKSLLLDS